ncbi:MAG: ABC transporter ATP-binding protein [Bacteroidales bacterium]|nr:ABC transporter ATP-binding protein [Bacteroidales bacterium]
MKDEKDIVLQVEDLKVRFDERTVVEGVNYTLRRGETLGIVGESGSGKSVSTLALMGLLPKNAKVDGSAMLEGTELLTLDEAGFRDIRGRRISMIFQEPMTSLNPVQKCGEQVLEMLKAHAAINTYDSEKQQDGRARVIELFKEVLLPRPEKIFDSYPHEISGGQKQRVMIAMALINHPDILIADEPTTALDVTVQRTILDLLRSLQEKHGTSIIFITHDLGVIAQIADRVMVMYRGKVVEQGMADDVLHHPQMPYTQGLLACRPPLDSRPERLPTVEEFLQGVKGCEKEVPLPLTPSHSPLISVKDLSVTYTLKKSLFGKPLQTLKGVDGISFDIMEGETLGLVGESGCGKSTLGRALLRLIDHSSGSILYRGQSLETLSRSEMRALRPKLQIIFQDPYSSLNPRITIGEAIGEPLRVHGLSTRTHSLPPYGGTPPSLGGEPEYKKATVKEQVLELMEQVGLRPEWYNRYPHEFSGGQRQRVCIARALILQPELVVCDESVSALDVSVQAQVLNLLNDLKRRYHYTYLFITHDLSVVKFLSDRIMVMQKGRIVESGTPDELFAHPQTDYTRTLIDAIPRIN